MAVKVTVWLTAEGLGVDVTVAVVGAWFTTSTSVPGVPAEKFWSPL
jgi:hypothetical protein